MENNKAKYIDKGILEESSQEQIEREWLLFKQINRINEAQSVGSMYFIAAIETLEINLWPELMRNPPFKTKLDEINKSFEEEIKKIRPSSREMDPAEKKDMVLFWAAKEKFKLLMMLMDKENLLPIRKANYYELESEKEEKRLIKKLNK